MEYELNVSNQSLDTPRILLTKITNESISFFDIYNFGRLFYILYFILFLHFVDSKKLGKHVDAISNGIVSEYL